MRSSTVVGLVAGLAVGITVGLLARFDPPPPPPEPEVGQVTAVRLDPSRPVPLGVTHVTLDGRIVPVTPDCPRTGTPLRVDLDLDGRHLTVWVQE